MLLKHKLMLMGVKAEAQAWPFLPNSSMLSYKNVIWRGILAKHNLKLIANIAISKDFTLPRPDTRSCWRPCESSHGNKISPLVVGGKEVMFAPATTRRAMGRIVDALWKEWSPLSTYHHPLRFITFLVIMADDGAFFLVLIVYAIPRGWGPANEWRSSSTNSLPRAVP